MTGPIVFPKFQARSREQQRLIKRTKRSPDGHYRLKFRAEWQVTFQDTVNLLVSYVLRISANMDPEEDARSIDKMTRGQLLDALQAHVTEYGTDLYWHEGLAKGDEYHMYLPVAYAAHDRIAFHFPTFFSNTKRPAPKRPQQ